MEIDFEKIFHTTLIALKMNGCHPDVKKDKFWFLKVIIIFTHFTSVFVLLVYNIIFMDIRNDDMSKACKDGVLGVVYVVVTFQMSVLLIKQECIRKLMNAMKTDFELAKLLPMEDQKTILQFAEMGAWISKQWQIITILASGLFPVKNVILILYSWIQGQFLLIPMYDLEFIGVVERNKYNWGGYLFILFYLNMYSVTASTAYVGFVPLGPTFMLHACGQLELVKSRVDMLFENDNAEIINEKLSQIVIQLQYIYSFVSEIESAFRLNYEMTLKATAIILPIILFEVLEGLGQHEVSLEFITFFFGGVLISSSPCYYSNLLMEKGEELTMSLYSCGWERKYDRRVRSTILLVLIRAQLPLGIRTPFRTVSLDALADMFHQSYAIFNLMNAAWE